MMSSKMAGLGMTYQEPLPLVQPTLSGDSDYTLSDIDKSDNVYKEICIDLENAGLSVIKIQKLTNPHLSKRYVTERDLIVQQRSKMNDTTFKLNERYLYHGTSAEEKYICEEGLDSRMSKQGCFGKGIYFSDYPKKCVKYAEKGDNTKFFILLSRVILGTPKVYAKTEKDRSLVREPEKKPPYTGCRFYDSVEGCPVNHKEFVVYESRRALVECLITYIKKGHVAASPNTAGSNNAAKADSDSEMSDSDTDLNDGPNALKGSDSSDDEDRNVNYREEDDSLNRSSKESPEALLDKKKKDFQRQTGVTDDYVVDRYLLMGHLNVSKAVKLYQERPSDDSQQNVEELKLDRKLELEFERNMPKKPEYPTPDSDQWAALNEEDKEAVIKGLIDDFRQITGLTDIDEEDYIRKRLTTENYDLDHAILAHYEEM